MTTELPPSSVLAFKEALEGGRGDLDAWLEVNDEAEVRDHVRAYAAEAVRLARQQALEEAARACEERSGTMSMFASSRDWRDHDRAIKGCAAAIRALQK